MVSCAPRLAPAVSGSGVRSGRACWAGVSAVPRPSWLGCRGVFFAFFFSFVVSVAGCPCPGPCGPCPPIPFFQAGLLALFFFVVCVCLMFRCPLSRWAAVPSLVLPVLAGRSPCASLGVLASVPSGGGGVGRLWWCWRAVWWLWAVFAPAPLPPLLFFLGGGGACPFLPLPSLGWRTHWPAFSVVFQAAVGSCVGRVGYVHAGLGAPSCRIRSWLCRLGGCARRLRVALA